MFLTFRRKFVILVLFCWCSYAVCLKQYGTSGGTLYVAEDLNQRENHITVINRNVGEPSDGNRHKREAPAPAPAIQKNISTWTTHLNDSHQQLMVHWVGEGSNVIICLARDSAPINKENVSPTALFVSYDYGKTFVNKTEEFKLDKTDGGGYARLDKFSNHPKYPEFCVFVDSTNKKIFYTNDNAKTIFRSDLDFHPSELAFDEEFPDRYVVLDKVDLNRRLYLTLDGGKTFRLIQSYVKTFYWSSGAGFPKMFYFERWKPDGTSTIFRANDPVELMNKAVVLFQDAKDFQIRGDYMFVTKQLKDQNTLDLYISHQRGPFYKAEFQTELDLKKFHIADVTDKRIFVSVMHTENLANLYVSEINNNFTQYNFVLSLEQVLCYFPDGNWKDSWLEDVTEDPFTDLYRVEGLRGIYIASKVESKTPIPSIGLEHLVSVISFDHGSTWSPINPPTEDENGNPLNCHIENSCSLHLCQKFSQLYPVTRSASIMSSKSAPGVLMATGVMGKSLKGIPGVYLSRDAGLTWKRILKDYYFFNYGDHGGVLVAVKYFKSRGETRMILYSTNEGIDWYSYQFNADDLRIYGLMTEPGENTTTFTMFGSANEQHQWIIITIDLFNAFAKNCTTEDYKYWSPSPPNSTISCVMGTKDTFQRRTPYSNCYNGISYDRPVKKEICPCSRRDFECDYGFMLSGKECVRNKSSKHDPYELPKDCAPGHYYKRTKGYRKIDGNACTMPSYIAYAPEMIPCPLKDPTEFILVALRDKIARIDLADNSTVFPVKDQKNIVAIEYDMKNNCIYWADIDLDKISRQCFSDGTTQEVIVDTNLSSIEGMALDWISNVLFFVDGMRRRIEAVRTDLRSEGRMRTTILDSKVLSKPRGIAVHPKAGYLFWTDWDRNNPSVSRSNLDGTNIKRLFGKPVVEWPNGITIDQMAERIYWVDAMEDYIASADLEGHYLKRILWNDEKVSHPFAVAVLKDKMYWDDWKAKSIFIADKDTGDNVITINNSFSGLMDLKVFAHFVQHGSNACSMKNTTCDTLCLGGPGNTYSCLCPDGFNKDKDGKCVCPNGLMPSSNMTCPKKAGTCAPTEFTCKNGLCISESWRCNGNNDCGDLSDEVGCPHCTPPMISCDDGIRCYLQHWKCDGDVDCADMSDEKDCGKEECTSKQFQCDNGHCIERKWLCDGDNDCKDGSDERNCTHQPWRPEMAYGNCTANRFSCSNSICIPNSWVCDGEADCPGGEDEKDEKCKNSTCASYMFRCPSGKCIFKSWVCDGENDCSDEEESDEKNCTSIGHSKIIPRVNIENVPLFPTNDSCLDWMFQCPNGNCVPYWWRCDHVDDCGDGADELECPSVAMETTTAASKPGVRPCSKNQFTCAPGTCIPLSWVCDTMDDCLGGEDERGCSSRTGPTLGCGPDETPCADGRGCVPEHSICDGTFNCLDHSDEAHCSPRSKTECPPEYFRCDDGTHCISKYMVCNNERDCYDGTDEDNCTETDSNKHFYQYLSIGVDQSSINSTSFLVSCWMAQQKMVLYSYLPSISKVSDGIWKNITWTNDSVYRFTNLQPFTNYNVTFYIQDSKSNKTYASKKYVNTTTGEGMPSPPVRLSIHQLIGSRVSVVWDPPKQPQGIIRYYTLHYSPPIPPFEKKLTRTNVTINGYFKPHNNYSFWLTATNNAFTSESSEVMRLTFDELGDIDELVNVSLTRVNDTAVKLVWHKIRGVDGYIVQVRPPRTYSQPKSIVTKDTEIELTKLPSGAFIYIDIQAYKGAYVGEPFIVSLRTNGEEDETLSLTATLVSAKRTSVLLSWNPPKGEKYKGKEILYELHYNNTFQHIIYGASFYEPVAILKNTSIQINNLHACESYVFAVGILGGPLSRMVEVATMEAAIAPVKKLKLEMDTAKSVLRINWHSNCDVMKEAVPYRLDVTELSTNKTSLFSLPSTKQVNLQHVFENVPEGGRYKVCVFANVKEAAVTCDYVRGKVIPSPTNVVAWLAPNGHIIVSWNDTEHRNNKYKYQIMISPKEIPEDTLTPTADIESIIAESSPYLTTAPVTDVDPLYVSVRTVNAEGYYSDMSEVFTIHMQGSEAQESTAMGAAVYWGAIVAVAIAIAIGAVAVHIAMRHRRLARSFLRFTSTPRYDNRRGQATIADNDDDDVPPIQGFSDDEPLVIA